MNALWHSPGVQEVKYTVFYRYIEEIRRNTLSKTPSKNPPLGLECLKNYVERSKSVSRYSAEK